MSGNSGSAVTDLGRTGPTLDVPVPLKAVKKCGVESDDAMKSEFFHLSNLVPSLELRSVNVISRILEE